MGRLDIQRVLPEGAEVITKIALYQLITATVPQVSPACCLRQPGSFLGTLCFSHYLATERLTPSTV